VSVLIVGGKSLATEDVDSSPESLDRPFTEGLPRRRISLDLTPEQRDEADRIERRLLTVVGDEARGIAELLASKPDRQALGEAEFQARDPVRSIGAQAIETAPDEGKKARAAKPD